MTKTIPTTYTAPRMRQWQAGKPILLAPYQETLRNLNHLYAHRGARVPLLQVNAPFQTTSSTYTQTNDNTGRDLDTYNPCMVFRRPYVNDAGDDVYGLRLICYGADVTVRVTLYDLAGDASITTIVAENTSSDYEWFEASIEIAEADVTSGGTPLVVGLSIEALSTNEGCELFQAYVMETVLTIDPPPTLTPSQLTEVIAGWRTGVSPGDYLEVSAGVPVTTNGDIVNRIVDVKSNVWTDTSDPTWDAASEAVLYAVGDHHELASSTTLFQRLHEDLDWTLTVRFSLVALPAGTDYVTLWGTTTGSGNGLVCGYRISGGTQQLTTDMRVGGVQRLVLTPTWTPVIDTMYTVSYYHVAGGDTFMRLDGSALTGGSGTPSAYGTGAAAIDMSVGPFLLANKSVRIQGFAVATTSTAYTYLEPWLEGT